jgi:hypothetical protein
LDFTTGKFKDRYILVGIFLGLAGSGFDTRFIGIFTRQNYN